MGRTSSRSTSVSFRIDPELKARFARIAEDQSRPIGEIMREFVRDFVDQNSRRRFEKEARRQSREAAQVAADPSSDEAQVLQELSRAMDERESG